MTKNRKEEILREVIRESIQESVMDDFKSGIGKAYDYLAALVGASTPVKPGVLKTLDDLSPGSIDRSSFVEPGSFLDTIGSSIGKFFDRTSDIMSGIFTGDGEFSAIILGDSQAGSNLGKSLSSKLDNLGFSVKIDSQAGAPGRTIADSFSEKIKGFDLAVVMFGGNDVNGNAAASAARSMIDSAKNEGVYLILIGPPPATKILDVDLAKRVFGGLVTDEMSHLRRENGDYAYKRIEISNAIQNASQGIPGVSVYGIASNLDPNSTQGSSDYYPPQDDGIHCNNGSEEIAQKILDKVNIQNIVSEIKKNQEEKIRSGIESIVPATIFSPGSARVVDTIRKNSRINLDGNQLRMAEIIEEIFRTEGFTDASIVAAIANAYGESGLDPTAVGDGGKSVGLFQLNIDGAGAGMTVEERKDPFINTRKIAAEAKQTKFMSTMRQTDDPQILAASFCRYVERPKHVYDDMIKRANIARDLIGAEDIESSGVSEV